MRLVSIVAIVLVCVSIAVAQNKNSDRCVVQALDITGKKLDELRDIPEKNLGSFDTVMAEEELTTRVYRLPKTKLFVIASVWYTDESMAMKSGAESVSLELSISKSRRRDLFNVEHYADSEVPLHGFEVARVTTMAKAAGKKFVVTMECRRKER